LCEGFVGTLTADLAGEVAVDLRVCLAVRLPAKSADEPTEQSTAPARASRAAVFRTAVLINDGAGDRRTVWVFAQGCRVSFSEDLHHPVMEVVHGVVEDRAEPAIVFLSGFVEIGT
jgi:hypothetical protein